MSSHRLLSWPRAARVLALGSGMAAGSVGLLTVWPRSAALDGPIYSVTALQRQVLHDHRSPWMDRTVLVRGLVTGYVSPLPQGVRAARGPMHLVLLDPGQRQGLLGALPLVLGPEDLVLQQLRLMPYIGQVLPPPPALDWGEGAVYRVTLRPLPDTSCDLCFMAEVRDAL